MGLLSENRHSVFLWLSLLATVFIGICAPRTMAFLPSVIAVLFYVAAVITQKQFLKPKKEEIIFFVSVIGLAFISSFWSPDTGFSMERSGKIASVLLPGALLLTVARDFKWPKFPLAHITIGLYLFFAIGLLIEKSSGHFLLNHFLDHEVLAHKLNRSFVVFALFSIPVLFLIKSMNIDRIKKVFISLLVILVTSVSLYVTISQTAQLSFLVGIVFLYLFPAQNKYLFKSLAGLILVGIFAFPFLMKPLQKAIPEEVLLEGFLREASIIYRLEVWNHAADKAFNSPIYGNGVEALRFLKSDEYMKYQKADSILHAHNAALQIWVEFGAIGVLLMMAFVFYIFKSIWVQENLAKQQLYLASFMACLSCAMTGYGFWQGWLLGLFFFIAAITLMAGKYSGQK